MTTRRVNPNPRSRGIPNPGNSIESLRDCVLAMKEVLESEVQGTRGDPNVARRSQRRVINPLVNRVEDLEARLDKITET